MKTKNKMIAMVEIAIVLCSVFLVVLPAIAAEQNTQKISAAEVTTSSKDDYVLDIYGNANEDDTIDMRDLTYVKLIFFGKKPETELADAKYDGKINPLDFIQIKLIIVGKEKEITLVDSADRIVTVKKPLNRIVCISYGMAAEVIRSLEAKEKVVGVDDYVTKQKVYFPELSKLPSAGPIFTLDYEAILALNPDLLIAYSGQKLDPVIDAGVTVACFDFYKVTCSDEACNVAKLGYIIDKEEEAKKFIDFIQEGEAGITELVKDIPEDDKPLVYVETNRPYHAAGSSKSCPPSKVCQLAGGRIITADLLECESNCEVDPEWVIEQNPDVIIRMLPSTIYPDNTILTDDPSVMKAIRDEIMNRPELANVNAVKNGRVHVMCCRPVVCSSAYCNGIPYMAKAFYPDLLKDLDHHALLQQFITEFQGLDFGVYEHGVFIYPPL